MDNTFTVQFLRGKRLAECGFRSEQDRFEAFLESTSVNEDALLRLLEQVSNGENTAECFPLSAGLPYYQHTGSLEGKTLSIKYTGADVALAASKVFGVGTILGDRVYFVFNSPTQAVPSDDYEICIS